MLGNVLYYRFVNPAIIAPEAFGVIEMSLKDAINAIQRRNLASIARVLQFAASGQKVLRVFGVVGRVVFFCYGGSQLNASVQ